MIRHFLPDNNQLPKCYNDILAVVDKLGSPIEETKYCPKCRSKIYTECENELCSLKSIIQKNPDSYLRINIINQVKQVVKTNFDSIQKYMNSTHTFMDYCNGAAYEFKPNTLNLTVSTDGIQLVKSGVIKHETWPLFCGIVELPPKLRECKNNLIIAGLWFGAKKPTSDIIFEGLIAEIESIKSNGGIFMTINGSNLRFDLKIHCIGGDVPAQALMLDIKYHGGYYSCPFCLIRGKHIFM